MKVLLINGSERANGNTAVAYYDDSAAAQYAPFEWRLENKIH